MRTPAAISLAFLLLAGIASAQSVPYRDLSREGTAFTESVPPHLDIDTLTAVRIGVLAPFGNPDGRDIIDGIRLAVDEANERGGYRGLPYRLCVRNTDGPWGVTTRAMVGLTYDDGVWAVIGGIDGGKAHLAELVSAKSWIPVVTPWASDLTIDYANVPWVFRIVPTDESQAHALWRYALERGCSRIVSVTEGSRDGDAASDRISEAADSLRHPPALALQVDPYQPAAIAGRILASHPDAVTIWTNPSAARALILALRAGGFTGPVLLPSTCAAPELTATRGELGAVVLAAPFDLTLPDSGFVAGFQTLTHREPRPSAFMGYDAADLVISAIAEHGLDRAAIRAAIAAGAPHNSSFRYRFSSLGGADTEPVLLTIRDGRWVHVTTGRTAR